MVNESEDRCLKQPKRLLVLSSTYPRWAEDSEPSFVHDLCRRLGAGMDVTVLCPGAMGAATVENLDGVRVVRYRYAPKRLETLVHQGGIVNNIRAKPWKIILLPSFLLSQLVTAFWLCFRSRPDVIHAHWIIPQGLVAALVSVFFRRKIPFVVTSHGTDLWSFKGRVLMHAKAWICRRASVVTVVSQAMKKELEEQVGKLTSVLVAPMGVDLENRFKPATSEKIPNRQIICVGRLIESKGVEYLIGAIPQLVDEFPDLHLLVVGDGPDRYRLSLLAEELGVENYCDFVGKVSHRELPGLFHNSSVFVAPFLQEGLGLVCIEALGSGCPVVASDIPAVQDILDSSANIHLVPVRNSKAIADAVGDVFANLKSELEAARASKHALRAKFGWERVSTDYLDVLKRASQSSGAK